MGLVISRGGLGKMIPKERSVKGVRQIGRAEEWRMKRFLGGIVVILGLSLITLKDSYHCMV